VREEERCPTEAGELDLAIKEWQLAFDAGKAECRRLREELAVAERVETRAYIKLQDALCARENLRRRAGRGWNR
jgi:hypothetical protein